MAADYYKELVDFNTTINNLKFIENGIEYWYAHDIAKVLNYSQFKAMVPAIERSRNEIYKRGIDPNIHIKSITEYFINGRGNRVPVKGYLFTRIGLYYVLMNADPRKQEVYIAKLHFVESTIILDKMNNAVEMCTYVNINQY